MSILLGTHYWAYVSGSGVFSVFCAHETCKSVWKKKMFPLRTLFLSNLWCSQSSEVELTPEQQHVPIIFGWSFVPKWDLFIYLFTARKNLWYKTRCQTGTLHTERGQKHYIFDEQQTCFLCPSWWHFTFLILLFAFDKVNWSDSLTDGVYVLFFSNRDSLCRYFTAFLMGRWVNDEYNFMDGQKWKMTINM